MSTPRPPLTISPWAISELLLLIFSFLDEKSLARSACVRRDWAETALDVLWRDVDDLPRLLSLLCPFAKPRKSTNQQGGTISVYKFRRPLTSQDWKKFERYSSRVHSIVYSQRSVKSWYKSLDPTIFAEIARTCPTAAVFSNLQSLTWNAENRDMQLHSLVFMHPRVRRFEVRVHASRWPSFSYLQQVAVLMPHLTHLTLRFTDSVRHIEDDLILLFRGLQRLQFLVIPLYGVTTSVAEELSTLEFLSDVSFLTPAEFGNGDRADVLTFDPALRYGAFSDTTRFSFSAQVHHATGFLTSPFFPAHLSSIHIHVLAVAHPDVVQQLSIAVRDSCPVITDLCVDFIICPDAPLTVPADPLHERPSIATFRPLFSCRRITSFEFRWDYALNLSDTDMEEFATSWPALEHLILNCEPVVEFAPPLLTLGALLPFARHCVRLRQLGLYMNADPAPPEQPIVPFKSLQKLLVGASNVSNIEFVALFLSQLCSLECKVVTGVRWPDAYSVALDGAGIFDERRMKMCDFWVRWNKVVEVLPVVTKARLEEKAQAVELRREVETLMLARQLEAERCERLEQEVLALRLRSANCSA